MDYFVAEFFVQLERFLEKIHPVFNLEFEVLLVSLWEIFEALGQVIHIPGIKSIIKPRLQLLLKIRDLLGIVSN